MWKIFKKSLPINYMFELGEIVLIKPNNLKGVISAREGNIYSVGYPKSIKNNRMLIGKFWEHELKKLD